MWFGAEPALMDSVPLPQGSCAGHGPTGWVAALLYSGSASRNATGTARLCCTHSLVLWPTPLGWGWAPPHHSWFTESSQGTPAHSSRMEHRRCLRLRALPAGHTGRAGHAAAGSAGAGSSPHTSAGGSTRRQCPARMFPRATACDAVEPLFSSGLQELPPLLQPSLTPHAEEVPSFIW